MRASFLRGLALLSKEADLRRVEVVETLSASACGHGSLVLQQEVPLSESRKATFDSFERDILSVNLFFCTEDKPLGGNLPLAMSSGTVKTIRRSSGGSTVAYGDRSSADAVRKMCRNPHRFTFLRRYHDRDPAGLAAGRGNCAWK